MVEEQKVTSQEIVTPQVTVEELQKQLAQFQETSKKTEDNWKNAERVSSQKEREIQRLREQLSSNESQANITKALIALISQQKGQPVDELEAEVKQKQPDLLKQYEEIVKETESRKKISELSTRIKGIQERTESLGISPQDEEYEVIRAFAEAGKFDKAEARLNKIESAKQTKPPEPKESDEERVKRLAMEYLKEKGLLTQETGGPSASASSRAEKIAKYARGEISTEEYNKIR